MPLNRQQFERYFIIHDKIRSGVGPTWRELAKACITKLPNLSEKSVERIRRTIFNDIENLKNPPFSAPIVSRDKGRYYYEGDFSLNNVILRQETELFKKINELMSFFAEMPFIEGFRDLQLLVADRLGHSPKDIIALDTNKYYVGLKHLTKLYEGTRQKIALKIKYEDFHKERFQFTVSPYLLKEYKSRWYIFGWDHFEARLVNLALDRIVEIQPSDMRFAPDKADVQKHLEHCVGVTVPEGSHPEAIRLKIRKPRAFYLKTKPLHHSQEIVEDTEDSITFGFRLVQNPELCNEIFFYGADAEVLSPASLRQKMTQMVKTLTQTYQT
ncbi:MAG: helix-turn-helix transcriptional regulator [Runella sp.]